tara:strand:+ start:1728 stop:1916 length:189 start_codon:yes stop_codon:yes gene_type:complete
MEKYFDSEQWRRIFKSFSDTPENCIGIEILRQHIYEHQKDLLTEDAAWYRHFSRNPHNPYLR